MITYYEFQSGNDSELHGFTDDLIGGKLPAEKGPWTLLQEVSSDEGWSKTRARKAVAVLGVAQNGFFLFDIQKATSSKPIIESDRVEGTSVFDPNGKQIGTIKRLLIEKITGRVLYADMVFGGFLGIGSHHHTIPWGKLTYDTVLQGYRTDITAEEVRRAPSFYDDDQAWPTRNRERETHDYWRIPPPTF